MRKRIKHAWRKWPFKHTTGLVITITLFILLLDSAIMTAFFEYIRELSYLGAFIAGILFVSLFTSAAAVVMLFELGQQYNLWLVTLIAGLGTFVGDYAILRYFEDKLVDEFNLILRKMGAGKLIARLRRKRMRGLLVVAGIGIIGSPLPDELGLGILDISHLHKAKILLICFAANLLGVLTIVAAGYTARAAI